MTDSGPDGSSTLEGNSRICNKHLEFIRTYFSIGGISVYENSQLGVILYSGREETLVGISCGSACLYLPDTEADL